MQAQTKEKFSLQSNALDDKKFYLIDGTLFFADWNYQLASGDLRRVATYLMRKPHITKLQILNQPDVEHIQSLGHGKIEELTLANLPKVTNLRPLTKMPRLSKLALDGFPESQLKHLKEIKYLLECKVDGVEKTLLSNVEKNKKLLHSLTAAVALSETDLIAGGKLSEEGIGYVSVWQKQIVDKLQQEPYGKMRKDAEALVNNVLEVKPSLGAHTSNYNTSLRSMASHQKI